MELHRIVTHLIGDGHVGGNVEYYNHTSKRKKVIEMSKFKRNIGCGRGKGITKKLIIEELKRGNLTSKKLTPLIGIRRSNINSHLRNLEKEEKVLRIKNNKKDQIWGIKV